MRVAWLWMLGACGTAVAPVAEPPGGDEPTSTEVPEEPTEPVVSTSDAALPGDPRSVPLYGGTAASQDALVVVANPTHDHVLFHHAFDKQVITTLLLRGSQPFRVAIKDTVAYVTLRGVGQVAAFDTDTGAEVARRTVCPNPRGIEVSDSVFLACAGGELMELDPVTLEIEDRTYLAPDLRDVVHEGDTLFVSQFRSARVLHVDLEARAVLRESRPDLAQADRSNASPRVAWRMVPHPEGGVALLHQAHSDAPIDLEIPQEEDPRNGDPRQPERGAYGSSNGNLDGVDTPRCLGFFDAVTGERTASPLVSAHVTHIESNGGVTTGAQLVGMVTPMDLVVHTEGLLVLGQLGVGDESFSVIAQFNPTLAAEPGCVDPRAVHQVSGVVTAIEFLPFANTLVHFDRQRSVITNMTTGQVLGAENTSWWPSDGMRQFHSVPDAGLSCASCHPEAQDDGHVWNFKQLGPRRTQNLAGGLMARGTFHWDAEFDTLQGLMDDVFTERMAGPALQPADIDTLADWLDNVAPVSATSDQRQEVLDRGQTLFEGTAGCTGCHNGPVLADHQLHVVRSGDEPRKTPSLLGVGTRAPYMSDGCAPTLLHRLTYDACGGDQHGSLDGLSNTELHALAAYVSTL